MAIEYHSELTEKEDQTDFPTNEVLVHDNADREPDRAPVLPSLFNTPFYYPNYAVNKRSKGTRKRT